MSIIDMQIQVMESGNTNKNGRNYSAELLPDISEIKSTIPRVAHVDTNILDKTPRIFDQDIEIDTNKLKTFIPSMSFVNSVDDLPKTAKIGEICIIKSSLSEDDLDVYIYTKNNRWESHRSFVENYNFDDEESLYDDDGCLKGFKD